MALQIDFNKYMSGFRDELYNLLSFVDMLIPTETTQLIMSKFEKLNMKKVMERYGKIVKPLEDRITNEDITIFDKKLFLIPEFDISFFWKNLPQEQKPVIWSKIKRLLIYTNIIFQNTKQPEVKQKYSINDIINNKYAVKGDAGDITTQKINTIIDDSKKDYVDPITQKICSTLGLEKIDDLTPDKLDEMENKLKELVNNSTTEPEVIDFFNKITSSMRKNLESKDIKNGNIVANVMSVMKDVGTDVKRELGTNAYQPDKMLHAAGEMMKVLGNQAGVKIDIDPEKIIKSMKSGKLDISKIQQVAKSISPMEMIGMLDGDTSALMDKLAPALKELNISLDK